jgi:hypothetical protein
MVYDLGSRVYRVQDLGLWVKGPGLRVRGLEFKVRVHGIGFRLMV